ncbi:Crp/Fnr family transcriptional regulator [Bdellovibrio sp.]|uniref:Crp/Fnr family transcriptional regulator n=1 Tax=Bdellovibrio TaxID=958 RepID=UPI0032215815
MSNIVNILKKQDFLRKFSERDLREISPYFELVHTMTRQVLFEKGQPIEHIYLVLYGSFKIQETIDRDTIKIFNFLSRDEFLGVAMAGLPNPRYPTSAISNEEGTLLKIPVGFFFDTLMQIPDLRRRVSRQISERFLEFQNDVCKSHKLAPLRIADFLLRLLDRQGPDQTYIQIPLTRADIADRVGSQSETVIRILSQWTKSGWIRTEGRHIEILDRQALTEVQGERPSKKIARGTSANPENV